ncbi:multidrug efflux pump subunit AcrA (membrane-fusion protein) [Sagittula marina]|uniref:Multidrug efflux pump subunit AcrA (Membrane-fusion protein) n=1 Tax=Sagittula marina TaxID=943940 RepID=A0A7W6GR76_9RHOB|nr:HlyD family efflux transporter periplasmic adaptor subunit [Sagittula marina]MBB3984288.1 multidrug efflux pump subunit AcrA (membrane-fusion protein) [Sagittula marina]
MRFFRKSLTGLFLFALTLGLLAWAGIMVREAVQARINEEPRERAARERVFTVNTVQVTPGREVPILSVFGEVQSARTLELRAAAGGTLMDLDPAFVEGGEVTEGQLLGRINPADAQSALDRAESDLLDAQAEGREAQRAIGIARDELTAAEEQVALRDRALRRSQDLLERRVGTEAAVETAELALSTARQAVLTRRQAVATAEARIDQAATAQRRAEIARDEASRRLDDTEIRAAFDGVLTEVTVVAGRLVSANEQLAQLVDPAALEVAFRVSTPQYARLIGADGRLRGAPVQVVMDVFGVSLTTSGTLSRESASVGEGQTGRLLFATLDAARGFKPGDFVTVQTKEPALENVARLPATALGADGAVLALGDDQRLQVVPVTLERRQGDEVIVRAEDLAGREVVAQRTPLLGAGIKVEAMRPEGAEDANVTDADTTDQMLELSAERRAALVAFVEGNSRMPEEARTRVLAQLQQDRVPADVVARIEERMGG